MRFNLTRGFPVNFQPPTGIFRLRYTNHATVEAVNTGLTSLPQMLDTSRAELVEIEVQRGLTTKLIYRVTWGHTDLYLAIASDRYPWGVLTLWTVRQQSPVWRSGR